MPNLLVVGRFPDANFVSCDYIFLYHIVIALQKYFDKIDVIAPTPYVPRVLAPFCRFSRKIREVRAKQDYAREKIRVHYAYYPPWASRIPRVEYPKAVWSAINSVVERCDLHPDIVHAHMGINANHGLKLARRYNVPSVVTIHDHHEHLMGRIRAEESAFFDVLKETDALIRVTPMDIDEIKSAINSSVPLFYVPNGFDLANIPKESRQTLRKKLSLPADRRIFVSVAHWDERKDPFILLEAMAGLKACGKQPLPLLCLIGGDNTRAGVKRRIEQLHLGDDVKFLGQRPPNEVLRHMRAGDAVLLYSHSEGNPTVMFEALGCGRPFIGSDVGGVRAVISDRRLGRYGPAGDVGALTRLLSEASTADWDEDFITDHAQRYSWDEIARQTWEQVYSPLIR